MINVLVLETHADAYAANLRERFSDLEIQVARSPADDHVDYGKVEVLIAFGLGVTEALFTRMPNLKWVQSLATGVDYFFAQ
jgi:phosphoglycerate dehydrogenase-like enzyme